jgi:hypothetical protein
LQKRKTEGAEEKELVVVTLVAMAAGVGHVFQCSDPGKRPTRDAQLVNDVTANVGLWPCWMLCLPDGQRRERLAVWEIDS